MRLIDEVSEDEIVRWPRSATSDIRHPSSDILHSFLVGAVMGVAYLLASAHVI